MPPAKRQRAHIGAGNIEPIRPVGIHAGIPVGRTQKTEHGFTLRDFLAGEVVDVLQRHPAGQLHRGGRSAGTPRSRW